MHRVFPFLIGMVLLGQAPPESAAYTVAYVDVAPASRTAAIAAIKEYRDASKKEGGFRRIEFFEQVGRSGHLCVIETWANNSDLDAHRASANAKAYRAKIDSMKLTDYDQRPYKTLSSARGSGGGGTFVITHVDIGGQGTNAPELLRKLAEASRKESGNLRFDVIQHTMRANHFTVIEEWQTAKAIEAHAAAAHTKEYRNSLAPIAGSPLDERLYKAVE